MTAQDIPSTNKKPTRLYFIDHLRAFLTILVVLHHVAMVYGGIQPFYYLEPPTKLFAFLVPMIFVLLNQAWFMGAFFLLAGYFTPGSYDRKGAGSFTKDRLVRLGIPLLIFYFVLNPLSNIGYFLMPPDLTGNTTPLTWSNFWKAYPELVGLGPLWFVAMLLVFSFGYVALRMLTKNQKVATQSGSPLPGYVSIGVFILVLAMASYLTRIVIPMGKSVLGFPTLAYIPQYLSFFALGTVAYRKDWLRKVRGSTGITGFIAAVIATITLFPIVFLSFLKALEIGSTQIPPWGFGTWQSAIYALWDSIFAVGMILAAITFFRRYFNGNSRFGQILAQQSFAVYIIHIPIIVTIVYLLRDLKLESLLKLGGVSLIVVPTCYITAFVIRKIPGFSKVI